MNNDLIWLGIGGIVLYYLYEKGDLASFGLSPTTTTTSSNTTNGTNTTQSQVSSQSGNSTNNTQSNITSGNTSPIPPATLPPTPPTSKTIAAPYGGVQAPPTTIATLQLYVNSWAAKDSNFVLMTSGQFAGQYMATPYHWNYYVSVAVPNIAINLNTAFPGLDLTQPITGNVFWNGAVAGQISSNAIPGVMPQLLAAGMSGLGTIAYNVNPYMQGPFHGTKVFGVGAKATGMERYIKVLGQ